MDERARKEVAAEIALSYQLGRFSRLVGEDFIAIPRRWLSSLTELNKTYVRSDDLREMLGYAEEE